MSKAICGYPLIVLMAAAAAVQTQTVEQPAYHEYVRFMQNKKEIRTGKLTVFTYPQWVQYCRGEYTGTVKRVGGLFDRTCRHFANPPSTLVNAPSGTVAQARETPANWNSMNAQ